VRGLLFFGFPLHAAGQPGRERATHLDDVDVPMLFLQGGRDALAEIDQLRPVVERLGRRATLLIYEHADHSFHVPARSGRTDAEVMATLLDDAAAWISENSSRRSQA
jgi:predicted alpha/beta-hydrolase family hydrolase